MKKKCILVTIIITLLMNSIIVIPTNSIAAIEDGEFSIDIDEVPYNIKIIKVAEEDSKSFYNLDKVYMLDEEGKVWKIKSNGILKHIFKEHRFFDIASGEKHTLAIDREGYLWTWGYNTYGQLGNGTTSNSIDSPIQIYPTKQFVSVACSNNASFAIDKSGNLYAWGSNKFGESYANDTIREVFTATTDNYNEVEIGKVPKLKMNNVSKISASGNSILAIDKEGYAYGWGSNYSGQLGNYNTAQITKKFYWAGIGGSTYEYVENPTKISETIKFKEISMGNEHSVLLSESGIAYTVGNNDYGQLGNGTDNSSKTLLIPMGLEEVKIDKVLAGRYHSTFIDENNNIWSCGRNNYGQLGNGTTTNSATIVKVRKNAEIKIVEFAIASIGGTIFAFDSNGDLWGWGKNNDSELLVVLDERVTSPVQITKKISEYTVTFKNGEEVKKIEKVLQGKSATAPELTKAGYTLSWDEDFSNITSDLEVNAIWTANTNTSYKVEHYVRNLDTEVEGYDLKETEEKTGTTDTTATAIYKEYEGFTKDENNEGKVESGNIAGDGSLVLKLYYSRNSYNINYELNEGTATGNLANKYTYGKEMILSNRVEKQGYTFGGWYDNENLTGNPITTIPNTTIGDKTFYAKWDAKGDTAYKVQHYKQKQDLSGYELAEEESKAGMTGQQTNAETKKYIGFTAQAFEQKTIRGEGDTVVVIYYNRNAYSITLNPGEGSLPSGSEEIEYTYGEEKELPEPTRPGYDFEGWYDEEGNKVEKITTTENGDKELEAKWEARTDTEYKIVHHYRNLDTEVEEYTEEEETKTGTTDTTVKAEYKQVEGFTRDENNKNKVESGNVAGDGSLVLKLYYSRNTYNITYELNGGTATGSLANEFIYGKEIILSNEVEKQGYTFAGWYDNEELIGDPIARISSTETGDKKFYAKWNAKGDIEYKVQHYKQKQDLSGYELADEEEKTGVTGAKVNAIEKIYSGYTQNTTHSERKAEGTILADGSLVLKLYYDRSEFTVTFKDGVERTDLQTINKGESATVPSWTKPGYTLTWDAEFTNVTSDLTVNAIWTAREDTAYKVEHYVRNLDTEVEGYELRETEEKTGTTDTTATAVYKEYEGFTKDENNSRNVKTGNIAGNGSLVLKLYYSRNTYNIRYELNGGTATGNLANSYIYGKEMMLSNKVEKEGYTFAGWYDNSELNGNPITTIPATATENKTLYAKWIEKDKEYYILSEKYNIDIEENTITKVSPETTVENFLSKIETNGTSKVLNTNGQEVSKTSLVGTGYKLQVTYKGQVYTYEIAVRGDIDGNGKLTVTDLSMLNQVLLKKVTLTGIKEKAANINYIGGITITDLSMLNQALMKKITL